MKQRTIEVMLEGTDISRVDERLAPVLAQAVRVGTSTGGPCNATGQDTLSLMGGEAPGGLRNPPSRSGDRGGWRPDFVLSNVLEPHRADAVFASYAVLGWIPDVAEWMTSAIPPGAN